MTCSTLCHLRRHLSVLIPLRPVRHAKKERTLSELLDCAKAIVIQLRQNHRELRNHLRLLQARREGTPENSSLANFGVAEVHLGMLFLKLAEHLHSTGETDSVSTGWLAGAGARLWLEMDCKGFLSTMIEGSSRTSCFLSSSEVGLPICCKGEEAFVSSFLLSIRKPTTAAPGSAPFAGCQTARSNSRVSVSGCSRVENESAAEQGLDPPSSFRPWRASLRRGRSVSSSRG